MVSGIENSSDTLPLPVDRKNKLPGAVRLAKKAVSLALALATLNTVAGSEMSVDAGKPEGPYTAFPSEYQWDSVPEKSPVIPAEARAGISIGDEFAGEIGVRGYNLVVKTKKIADALDMREIAVITQTETYDRWGTSEDRTYTSRYRVLSSKLGPKEQNLPSFLTDNQEDIWRGYASLVPLWGMSSARYTKNGKLPAGQHDVGAGVDAHSTARHVRLQVIQFEPDGSVVTEVDQTTPISFVDNAACADRPTLQVNTEIELTNQQHATVCKMLEDYGSLLSDGYRITLDPTESSYQDADSQSQYSRSIQLTYPYSMSHEVPEQDFRRTALHEILHAAYTTADQDSRPVVDAGRAYRRLRAAMDYKMPSDKVRDMSDLSVGRAEDVWGVVTESTYIGPESRHGHPWDNPTEMISSTAAVMTFYPDGFVAKFDALSLMKQAAVYDATRVATKMIEHYGVRVDAIIPRYFELNEYMQRSMKR